MSKPTIGFIGLGIMGKPMAHNLLNAGYPLVVHSRSRPQVDELAGEGASPAYSPRQVAGESDLVITLLPDSPDVELVALGPDGLIEAPSPLPLPSTWRRHSRARACAAWTRL